MSFEINDNFMTQFNDKMIVTFLKTPTLLKKIDFLVIVTYTCHRERQGGKSVFFSEK